MKNVGLLGAGTVGSALVKLLAHRDDIPAEICSILVRDSDKSREGVASGLLTTDPYEVLAQPDILIETMGGTDLAGDLMLEALGTGKRVVTANKAALAERWAEFVPFLNEGRLYFEATVMAGTPVIGPLTGALRGSSPLALHAILNGTCSYMLNELEKGVAYDEALAEAQRLGYAEADPTLDVGGFDAAHKLTLLARLTCDPNLTWEAVKAQTKGIEDLNPEQVQGARSRGGWIQLVGSVTPAAGAWQVKVRPVFVPGGHPLARAPKGRNALLFRGNAVGDVLITGAGAGGSETASGVLADLIAAVNDRPGPSPLQQPAPVPSSFKDDLEDL